MISYRFMDCNGLIGVIPLLISVYYKFVLPDTKLLVLLTKTSDLCLR